MLDRPVWTALNTRHSDLALGGDLARRYPSTIVPFAATGADDVASQQAFDDLVRPGDELFMLQKDEIVLPAGLSAVMTAAGVQMVREGSVSAIEEDTRVERLSPSDAAAMLELATLTRPGPFTLGAMRLGEFWGVKIGGRLAAMAGERMKQPGHVEISGVCSHPEFRGRGLARLLSIFVANRIAERGDDPYLHAFATNAAAIRLYESIGFRMRSVVNFAVVRRKDE